MLVHCAKQKSRIVSFIDRGPPSWDQGWQSDGIESSVSACERTNPSDRGPNALPVENLSSSHLTELVEGAVEEFATQVHPAELSAFIDYIKSQFPELRKINVRGKSAEIRDKASYSLESLEQDLFLSIHKEIKSIQNSDYLRDSDGISSGKDAAKSLLLGKYIAALTKGPKEPSQNSNSSRDQPGVQVPSYNRFGPSDCDGIHVSSCGHAVHQGCLDRYLSSLKERSVC